MLADTDRGVPAGLRTRIMVEPPRRVALSVLPAEEPARAQAVSVGSGIPEELLRRYGARVRQTHRRANVVVLEVPADRQEPLLRELAAAGVVARAPKPVYPLLNGSVPSLAVPAVWRSGRSDRSALTRGRRAERRRHPGVRRGWELRPRRGDDRLAGLCRGCDHGRRHRQAAAHRRIQLPRPGAGTPRAQT